jgi:alpha-acetolactate decarboxylase
LAQKGIGLEMTFTTDNIQNDFQKASDVCAMPYEPMAEKARAQKVAYLREINGFLIEICTPMKTD